MAGTIGVMERMERFAEVTRATALTLRALAVHPAYAAASSMEKPQQGQTGIANGDTRSCLSW